LRKRSALLEKAIVGCDAGGRAAEEWRRAAAADKSLLFYAMAGLLTY
jgi:hypothetical protein